MAITRIYPSNSTQVGKLAEATKPALDALYDHADLVGTPYLTYTARLSADVTLAAATDVAGMTLTLPAVGTWQVDVHVDLDMGASSLAALGLVSGGAAQAGQLVCNTSAASAIRLPAHGSWLVTTTAANTVCKLKTETLLGGTCNAKATHTWMHARRVA